MAFSAAYTDLALLFTRAVQHAQHFLNGPDSSIPCWQQSLYDVVRYVKLGTACWADMSIGCAGASMQMCQASQSLCTYKWMHHHERGDL